MIIDSHVHFWDPARGDDILIVRRESAMRQRFYPEDLRPLLEAAGVERCVVIQSAPNVAESRHLLELVRGLDWIHGVVGWVDLESEDVAGMLAHLRCAGPLTGVRVMLHRLDDAGWISRPAVARGLRALAAADLSLDLITEPRHIAAVRAALIAVPEVRAIINHGATPPIATGALEPWAGELALLARETKAWCKFSGLREVAGPDPDDERILPYARHLLAAFGPRRLLYASNWPVCDLAGGHARWWSSAHVILDRLGVTAGDQTAIFGGNAIEAYRTPTNLQTTRSRVD